MTVRGTVSEPADHGALARTARAILTLTAAGVPVPEVLLDELASGVLAEPAVALAMQVAEVGPHRLTRGIELAEILLPEMKEAEGSGQGGEAAAGRAAV